MYGVIDWVSPDRVYGFLRDDAGRAVSLRRPEIEALAAGTLVVGQPVEFDLAQGPVIPVAKHVRVIYGCQLCPGCGWCDWPR